MWNQARRLYVAEFKCGVIKIGITKQPGPARGMRLRLRGHQPVRIHYGSLHECGFWGEKRLIERMGRIASTFDGREWFTGIRFHAARVLVDQISTQAVALHAAVGEEQGA